MKKRQFINIILFVFIAVAGTFADLASKYAVFAALGLPGEYRWKEEPECNAVYWIWDGVFGFQTSLNQGALFGMGQGRSGLFAVFSVIALFGIFIWLFHSAKKSRFLVFTLGLITAGIIGNFYDRLGWHGLVWHYSDKLHNIGDPVYAVRDWILVMLGSYPYPNFNIADSMLVCGAILLMIQAVFFDGKSQTAKQ
ncbi:MAG: signal peptidase II [Planctomycetaceae bacterium]|jgi:signal peptidase II|nr:signal peptidase II [Planctomycetaceae bacterium]